MVIIGAHPPFSDTQTLAGRSDYLGFGSKLGSTAAKPSCCRQATSTCQLGARLLTSRFLGTVSRVGCLWIHNSDLEKVPELPDPQFITTKAITEMEAS